MYLWFTYKLLLVIALISTAVALGLWFFPDTTRAVIGYAIANAKPLTLRSIELLKQLWRMLPL